MAGGDQASGRVRVGGSGTLGNCGGGGTEAVGASGAAGGDATIGASGAVGGDFGSGARG
jgi:hypothetical protein